MRVNSSVVGTTVRRGGALEEDGLLLVVLVRALLRRNMVRSLVLLEGEVRSIEEIRPATEETGMTQERCVDGSHSEVNGMQSRSLSLEPLLLVL